MYYAEEARKAANFAQNQTIEKWSILDELQLRSIERKKKRAAAKGEMDVTFEGSLLREQVKIELERRGYTIVYCDRVAIGWLHIFSSPILLVWEEKRTLR